MMVLSAFLVTSLSGLERVRKIEGLGAGQTGLGKSLDSLKNYHGRKIIPDIRGKLSVRFAGAFSYPSAYISSKDQESLPVSKTKR